MSGNSFVIISARTVCVLCCDPDCLVQPPNSPELAPKSIGEGASSLFGGWPGSPENISCSSATPDLHRCNLGVALEQETFSGLPGHPPKRLLAPSPIDLGEVQAFRGLYQAVRVASFVFAVFFCFFHFHLSPRGCRPWFRTMVLRGWGPCRCSPLGFAETLLAFGRPWRRARS